MATASTPNSRASLLAGLRTGGVRSASQPLRVPHTAAPGGSFNVPRFSSGSHPTTTFPEEDEEDDHLPDIASLNFNTNNSYGLQAAPLTASAADSGVNKFQQQQQQHQQLFLRQMATQRAALAGGNHYGDQAEMQAQMMQMEMLKFQAFQQAQQAQQYQAELIAQAQRQQAQQMQQPARASLRRNMEPMTAGPTTTSFDLRSAAAAQLRARAENRSGLSAGDEVGQVPMTAAIGGKFATRALNPNANTFIANRFGDHDDEAGPFAPLNYGLPPPTPGRTTVISGGTSLGTPLTATPSAPAPSKSDTAISWRRGGSTTTSSVLRSGPATPPANIKVNRISNEETSPPGKARPQPLRFSNAVSSTVSTVALDTTNVDEDASSGSSKAGSPTSTSTPSTPPSAHYTLSAESKKPYEGVGMGRPVVNGTVNGIISRQASMPSRQPKGPPSGAEELGPRNFATRLRKKAIGGLDSLVAARERRDMAIEIQAY